MSSSAIVGVVVIGRNEGERLSRCLSSPELALEAKVYVDSGSKDESLNVARAHDFPIIELNSSTPFTAARARNTGFDWLTTTYPNLEFVQFVDADSELQTGWIAEGAKFLRANEPAAAVCGNLRELDPDKSVFNHLCDLEWRMPNGEIESVGGIAMFRRSAFANAGGFREDLIAGEEPDLCFRLRRSGWSIFKIDVDMAVHDANLMTPKQWWARAKRSGYATAQALSLRGRHDRAVVRSAASNVLWALPPAWLLWPAQWLRLQRKFGRAYATHVVLGKVPHFQGQIAYWWASLRKRRHQLIEHK